MTKESVLTIQQIIQSENDFIRKYSLEKILNLAGKKISEFLFLNFKNKKILFVCGTGNNGNDGIYASKFLITKMQVSTYQISKQKDEDLKKLKKKIKNVDIIIDCIFGIGLNRKITGNFSKIIDLINKSKKRVISVDIPSGINSDSGKIYSNVIKSSVTVAMGFFKPAHFLLPSKEFCGTIKLLNLGLKVPKKYSPRIFLLEKKKLYDQLPKFGIDVNKYNKGHVLVIGGEMSGAARISAISSRKIGAGLSTIAVLKNFLKYYEGTEPGTILTQFKLSDLKKKEVMVIGPGLGKFISQEFVTKLIKAFEGPIIIDADALSIFKNCKKIFYNLIKKKKNIVITPHEGEFTRLFDINLENKVQNTLLASKLIDNAVLFKGNDTVLAFPDEEIWIDNISTNKLATAGTGDMLCGLIAGLLAQKMEFRSAIKLALWIHGKLSTFKRNVIVEDFINSIPKVLP